MEPIYDNEETEDLYSYAPDPMSRPANEEQFYKLGELLCLLFCQLESYDFLSH